MFRGQIELDLGAAGDPHQSVKEAFEQRGMRIADETITRLRTGKISPTRTAYRLACAEKLRANDGASKTAYCLQVARVGLRHRQPSREPPRVYGCLGLTRAMQAALGCTRLELSYVLRIMRADLALWSTRNWNHQLVVDFPGVASLFLRVHGHRNWRMLHGANDVLGAAWDGRTIHGFYAALYAVAGSLTRAAWVPYELDLLERFYARLQELGNPLTPLDRQALASAVNRDPRPSWLVEMVRTHVGVEYDEDCVTTHHHLLATGSPGPVRQRRR